MRRVLPLIFLFSLFAVPTSEADPRGSNEHENQAGGRGRGRGQTGQITREAVPVPEPTSFTLFGAGAVAVAWWLRHRR